MPRPLPVLTVVVAVTLLGGLAVAGSRGLHDLHVTRVRLDQQQRGVGAMPELQRAQLAVSREQLATAQMQLAITRELLASSRRLEALGARAARAAEQTRALVEEAVRLERRIAQLTAEINRKQYQPPEPLPSSPSR